MNTPYSNVPASINLIRSRCIGFLFSFVRRVPLRANNIAYVCGLRPRTSFVVLENEKHNYSLYQVRAAVLPDHYCAKL